MGMIWQIGIQFDYNIKSVLLKTIKKLKYKRSFCIWVNFSNITWDRTKEGSATYPDLWLLQVQKVYEYCHCLCTNTNDQYNSLRDGRDLTLRQKRPLPNLFLKCVSFALWNNTCHHPANSIITVSCTST